ncbi:MAG: DUF1858 domain-containing protein [Defluviitaleaceae bacterium]|nr:DUF1858 domain-containing protein [Defluviitaleaceae bacterium]
MISKDMVIADIIDKDRRLGMFLMQNGMHCFGCGAAQHETLEEACAVHGFGADKVEELVTQMNSFLEKLKEAEAKAAN